jgi:HAD superfamily hydrolase (TIGR01509 family)
VLGFTNREILMYLFRRRLTDREVLRYSREKESLYRNQCLAHPGSCLLAPGAESFLDLLKERNIARTIATASIQENVWFFNRTFDLERWFTFEHIVFDNGTLRGKPFPDMFLAAATALGTPMDHCMVIEDSISGIRGALNAGAGRVVAISPIEAQNKFRDVEGIHQVVSDFSEVDCSGFPPPERA